MTPATPKGNWRWVRWLLIAAVVVGAAVAGVWFFSARSGDPRLRQFVHAKPPFPIVFTSRSNTASFRAAASTGDYSKPGATGLTGSGQPQWQADEGRLRLLTPDGEVHELTWGKPLHDGGTLIDVMSPSVSADARTVVFAGRRADADGGRFRIYAVELDGSGLRQMTGFLDDAGCTAAPPLRYAADGTRLTEEARRRLDYDDVDPVILPNGALVYASSRTPDLGGKDRRATQMWLRERGSAPRPLSASRANDRWPVINLDYTIWFTLWSRTDEVVADDGMGIVRYSPPRAGLTSPTDRWAGMKMLPTGENFAYVVKVPQAVWRVRPLCAPAVTFMTPAPRQDVPFTAANEHPENGPLRVARAGFGQVSAAPSSLGVGSEYPALQEPPVRWAPALTPDGRRWSLATPSPLPSDRVLVSAAPLTGDGTLAPSAYGLHIIPQEGWPFDADGTGELTPLFDDPALVDAEPVAAYPRDLPDGPIRPPTSWAANEPRTVTLANGKTHTGPAGEFFIPQISTDLVSIIGDFPGQVVRGNASGRAVPPFKPGEIADLAFYACHRDRFDDPDVPVIPGGFERVMVVPTDRTGLGRFKATVPVGSPTLLAGLDENGRVVSATGVADSDGRRGKYYAFAGDHVSGVRAGGYHFCVGCHTGHTFTGVAQPEKVK